MAAIKKWQYRSHSECEVIDARAVSRPVYLRQARLDTEHLWLSISEKEYRQDTFSSVESHKYFQWIGVAECFQPPYVFQPLYEDWMKIQFFIHYLIRRNTLYKIACLDCFVQAIHLLNFTASMLCSCKFHDFRQKFIVNSKKVLLLFYISSLNRANRVV